MERTESVSKVTGAARYAVEQNTGDDPVYCWHVPATVAKGRVVDVATDLGEDVLAVLWHGNAEKLGEIEDTELAVLQSDRVAYRGQIVAAVVAATLQAARDGAARAKVTYADQGQPDNELTAEHSSLYAPETVNAGFPTDVTVGDPEAALALASHTIDHWYATSPMHNSPMEPHATTAKWADGTLTMWDSTQAPSGVQGDLTTLFGLDSSAVRVVAENVGGGFGGKGSTRPNAVLAAMAARATGRTVKLALPCQAMFDVVVTGPRRSTMCSSVPIKTAP